MNNIFDSHAHYDSDAFEADRKELLSALPSQGVCGIINCGSDMASSISSLELADEFDFVYAACGIHPHEAVSCQQGYLPVLKKLCMEEKCVAVGEIGLDYHYDFSPRDKQKQVFEQQILLAKELDLPVIVHDREAHEDTLELLKRYKPKGVVHCFSGSPEMAAELIKIGMYIGISGVITFKNAKKLPDVVKMLPMDKLLLETDAPYLAPVPYRGKTNNSSMIYLSAEKIGEIKNIDTISVLKQSIENTKTLFRL